jgi:hypothetical protein
VSLFEFVTVMISIILALSLGQLLTGLTFLIKTDRQVRWHAPHTLWLVFMWPTLVNHWWSLWDFNTLEWNYAAFMYVLIAPVLIAFAVGLLSPDRSDSASNDLAGAVVALVTGNYRANVLAPSVAATSLATVMLIRFLR